MEKNTSPLPPIAFEDLKKANAPFEAGLLQAFHDVLGSGRYVLGRQVQEFEEAFARYCGTACCVGVASGLDALTLALEALALPRGSEVIVPANSFMASVLAVIRAGLKPVLAEPDPHTYNLCPAQLEALIRPKTMAVMAVHLYGKPCAMDAITQLVAEHGLALVEDCAQAHGARHRGRAVGSFGNAGAFSFYPVKNLGALGDAGAVVSNDAKLAEKIRVLGNYGTKTKYENIAVGHNSRLDELQAAFLKVKLAALDQINAHKRQLAAIYFDMLDPEKFVLPQRKEGVEDVFHIFNIRHPEREAVAAHLQAHGIGTGLHYPVPPHRQPAFRRLFSGQEFPVTDMIHRTTLSLPISFGHTPADIMRVAETLNGYGGR